MRDRDSWTWNIIHYVAGLLIGAASAIAIISLIILINSCMGCDAPPTPNTIVTHHAAESKPSGVLDPMPGPLTPTEADIEPVDTYGEYLGANWATLSPMIQVLAGNPDALAEVLTVLNADERFGAAIQHKRWELIPILIKYGVAPNLAMHGDLVEVGAGRQHGGEWRWLKCGFATGDTEVAPVTVDGRARVGPLRIRLLFSDFVTAFRRESSGEMTNGVRWLRVDDYNVVTYEFPEGVPSVSLESYTSGQTQRVGWYSLPGDVDGNRAVNIQDLIALRNRLNEPVTNDTCRYDVTLDGQINTLDLIDVRAHLNESAPNE